jgi:hypothetical protein
MSPLLSASEAQKTSAMAMALYGISLNNFQYFSPQKTQKNYIKNTSKNTITPSPTLNILYSNLLPTFSLPSQPPLKYNKPPYLKTPHLTYFHF